jgi:hypothetical protein
MANSFNILAASLMLLMAAGLSSAEPISVYGFVTDETHALPGIAGANVTITCDDESSTAVSDHKGFYFGMLECDEDEITVTANKGTRTGSNSGESDDEEAEIDVELSGEEVNVEIPEFPSQAVPALLSMLSFGMLRLRKK